MRKALGSIPSLSSCLVSSCLVMVATLAATLTTLSRSVHIHASAGNRTRVTSMATMYSTTRPLMLLTNNFRGGSSIRASRIWRRSSADPQKQWISHYKGFQSNGVSFNKALPLKVICFFWGLSFYSNSFRITGFPFREYFPPYGLLQGIVPDEYTGLSVETCQHVQHIDIVAITSRDSSVGRASD